MELSREKRIDATQTMIRTGYDMASGGIPPNAYMLERVVANSLDERARREFTTGLGNNMLSSPGLTYIFDDDMDEANAYFGVEFAGDIQVAKDGTKQLYGQVGNFTLWHLLGRESFDRFTPEAYKALIADFEKHDYFDTIPTTSPQHLPHSASELWSVVFNAGGNLSDAGSEAADNASNLIFDEPLYSRTVDAHASKVSLMNAIMKFAAGQMESLGLGSADSFDYEAYFGQPNNEAFNTNFQKYYGRRVPGTRGLTAWVDDVLVTLHVK